MIVSDLVLRIGKTLIGEFFTDKGDKDKATVRLLEMQEEGRLKETEMRAQLLMADATSNDKWVSRARPAFLYVVYIYLLISIPFGILAIFNFQAAQTAAQGVTLWISAIPNHLWDVFAGIATWITGLRSFDKRQLNKLIDKNK